MLTPSFRTLLRFVPFVALLCITDAAPSGQSRSTNDGVFTEVQANRGQALYGEHCAQCHGANLAGVEQAPPLAGPRFLDKWNGAPLRTLFDRVVSMPPSRPNSLTTAQYADVLAYLLSAGDIRAGATALPFDRQALGEIVLGSAIRQASSNPSAPSPARPPTPQIRTAAPAEWRTYGGDLASTRYAPIDQIDATNFSALQMAWRLNTDAFGPRPDAQFSATPLMVGGVLYTTAGTRRAVVALKADTGELLWIHREDEGARGLNASRNGAGRGLSYWSSPDGSDQRILYVTPGYRLIALDARTGTPIASFGTNGVVDLKVNDDQDLDLDNAEVGLNAPPLVANDVVVVGAAHRAGIAPKTVRNAKGYVRGFDVRTGRRLWIFHTIPRAGEFGHDTWAAGAAEENGNTGVWSQLSADLELNLVYLPVESPTGDYYGGHRHGQALFAESLVAVDLTTGQRRWHYQTTHHGVWDYDLPCAPILFDVTIDGRRIKALAQPTKQAFLFVLDRETGKPIWPIEERPVPQSTVPGERTSPTQPFPTRPAPFDRQGLTADDLIDFTPALRAEALTVIKRYQIGPLYTPPVVSNPDGPIATLQVPADEGGANWPGGSYDPETGRLYIHSHTGAYANGLVPGEPARTDMRYVSGQGRPALTAGGGATVRGLPLLKPPYDRITAYDMRTGEILWQKAHSSTPDDIRNNPALAGLDLPRLGQPGRTFVGTLATKTLLIAGDGGVHTNATGQRVALLRAYDKATGADVGSVEMPAKQTGSPMTYVVNGKQFIVLAVSGVNGSQLIAFALP